MTNPAQYIKLPSASHRTITAGRRAALKGTFAMSAPRQTHGQLNMLPSV
jgi:hypothetical protein